MFSYFRRKKNIRIALSQQESFQRRLGAIYALGERPATPEAIRALAEIAQSDDKLELRQCAISHLASLSEPDSIRVLLRLVTSNYQPNNWIFIEAFRGLRWNTITLNQIADEALIFLLQLGRNAIRWDNNSLLGDVRSLIGRLTTPATRSALEELDKLLRERRTVNLPNLLKIALESQKFDEAESAIAEIAGLGTDEAYSALVKIRQQPVRQLEHSYETDNEEVEAGYSPKWVSVTVSSSELGKALSGPERTRWEAAL